MSRTPKVDPNMTPEQKSEVIFPSTVAAQWPGMHSHFNPEKYGLTGLFAISGYSGKASGRFFGGFGGDFPVVFGLLPAENSGKNRRKSL